MLKFFKRPRVEEEKISDLESRFTIGAYEKGYAITIGNALRRVLLSSMPKFAPVAIQVSTNNKVQQGKSAKDVGSEVVVAKHELDVLEGIYEDVHSIILNVKELIFIVDENLFQTEDELLELGVENHKGVLTAGDLDLPAGVQVLNKDKVIFQVAPTDVVESVSFKVFLRHGRGYWLAEENRKQIWDKSNLHVSIVPIDTNFSPVSNVSYNVEGLDMYERPHESLVIKVRTDNSITPREALELAGRILEQQFGAVGESSERQTLEEVVVEEDQELKQDNFSLEELDLDKRTLNALKAHGVKDFRDLISRTEKEVKGIQNLGEKSFDSLKKTLKEREAVFAPEAE